MCNLCSFLLFIKTSAWQHTYLNWRLKILYRVAMLFPAWNMIHIHLKNWFRKFPESGKILQRHLLLTEISKTSISIREYISNYIHVNSRMYQLIHNLNSPILQLTHWGRDKMNAISQTTLSRAFSSMKIVVFWLNFHWNMFARVQLTIIQHWFR